MIWVIAITVIMIVVYGAFLVHPGFGLVALVVGPTVLAYIWGSIGDADQGKEAEAGQRGGTISRRRPKGTSNVSS